MANTTNKKIGEIEIRGIAKGSYQMIVNIGLNILRGQISNYDTVDYEKPKTYKIKRN